MSLLVMILIFRNAVLGVRFDIKQELVVKERDSKKPMIM